MKKEEFLKIRKEEGDELTWNHDIFKCKIIRHKVMLHLCGYVGVPKNHFLYKKTYSVFEQIIHPHGGITFSGFFDKDPKEYWYIGFDCSHYEDLIPKYILGKSMIYDVLRNKQTYKDINFVKDNIKILINKLEAKENMSLIYKIELDNLEKKSAITKIERVKFEKLMETNYELFRALIKERRRRSRNKTFKKIKL
jgi:hypothetical protein